MNKTEINCIELVINGKTIRLTPYELRELGETIIEMYPPAVHPLTTYPVVIQHDSRQGYWSDPIPIPPDSFRITCVTSTKGD